MNYPKVSIIILNWNGAEDTIRCVESFSQLQYSSHELVVVDNGSTDDSVQRIERKFPDTILIETGKNLGYAGGNNTGIRYAINNKAEYVLIVNNDTEVVNPNFLQEMVDKMEEDPSIGIIGPRVLNPGGFAQETILFFPTLSNSIKASLLFKIHRKDRRDYTISQSVEAVCGVCWLIRGGVIKEIGLLDEDYFMYAEEQDYCYRAKKTGWEIKYFPVESVLHHKCPEDGNIERTRRQYIYARRNLVLFLRKHFGFWRALVLAVLFLISNAFKVVLSKLTGQERDFYNISLLSVLYSKIKWALSRQRI